MKTFRKHLNEENLDFYNKIKGLEYESNCSSISMYEWEDLMEGAVDADKKEIEKLIKEYLPELYEELALQFNNPYDSYKTNTYLIYVHSAVEYFLKIVK